MYMQTYNPSMPPELITVAQLRAKLADVLKKLQRARSPVYVTQRGQARAVLLRVEEYEGLLEQLEYLEDSLEAMRVKRRIDAGAERTEPLESVMRRLRKRGRVRR